MGQNKRDLLMVGGLWLVLTAIGLWASSTYSLLPIPAAEQAGEIDNAFNTLFLYAMPVFMLVIAVLVYGVARWRVKEPEQGAEFDNSNVFSWTWLGVSVGLATLVFVTPGLTGFLALRDVAEPDVVIDLTGVQWHWDVGFPNMGMTMEAPAELLLPKDKVVRFDMTSVDVLHSFWVPAFRMKQDVIPGEVSSVTITPTELGTFEEDPVFRLQCAELCGTGHSRMFLPVRVVEPEEFEAWLAGMGDSGMDMGGSTSTTMDMGGSTTTSMDMSTTTSMDMTTTTVAEG
jgi:cytochrome c oxidase subunit II